MLNRNMALFGLICLIWGLTLAAAKTGMATVPPLFFAGTRFLAAGILIVAFLLIRGEWVRFGYREIIRLIFVSLLMVTLTYGLLFWGMLFVNSGTAALLEMSFTPVALLTFALIFRQETFDPRRLSAILFGVIGLVILFGPKMTPGTSVWEVLGALATVTAAATYALGSILARPLIGKRGPYIVAASTMVIGGGLLLGISLNFEPNAINALRGDWGSPAWAAWLFLLIFGSLVGFTAYLHLLSRWGASKAGSWAFVSPVIAVLIGMLMYGEQFSNWDAIGMVVMLAAALVAVRTEPRLVAKLPSLPPTASKSTSDVNCDRAAAL